jgi:hypothetical protein
VGGRSEWVEAVGPIPTRSRLPPERPSNQAVGNKMSQRRGF